MKIEKNQTFSTATLHPMHLIRSALPYVDEAMQGRIRAILANDDMEAEAYLLWHEEIWDMLIRLAPQGTYFGTLEGDGSHFGWWNDGDEQSECELCAREVWSSDLIPCHYGQRVQYMCGACYDKYVDPDTGKYLPQDDE